MALFKENITFIKASQTLGYQAHSMMFPESSRAFLSSYDPTKDKMQLVYSMIGSLISAEAFYMKNKIANADIEKFLSIACEFASMCNGNKPESELIEITCNNNLDTILNNNLSEHDAISRITDNFINWNGLQNISQPYADNLFNNILQTKTIVDQFFKTFRING